MVDAAARIQQVLATSVASLGPDGWLLFLALLALVTAWFVRRRRQPAA
ncbi:hypothetical protein [Nocardioides aurantiacus]|nr:hypothetical protein [Nocardioides aurantiacus]